MGKSKYQESWEGDGETHAPKGEVMGDGKSTYQESWEGDEMAKI